MACPQVGQSFTAGTRVWRRIACAGRRVRDIGVPPPQGSYLVRCAPTPLVAFASLVFFGVRWLDTALDLGMRGGVAEASARPHIQSDVEPPRSKKSRRSRRSVEMDEPLG